MSAAPINRSLANIRTELEFLLDSEVINKELFDALMESLPKRYTKEMSPWGVDKIPAKSQAGASSGGKTDALADSMSKTSLVEVAPPANPPSAPVPERKSAPALGYCKATFNYSSSEPGDMNLSVGDRVAVVEHLSPDWWKGYKQGESAAQTAVFPSNYVTVISEAEFGAASASDKTSDPEKASYSHPAVSPPSYNQPQQYQQPYQQPSYGGYAQFPPANNQYPQGQAQTQQTQTQSEQQAAHAAHFKKFGSKLGNAAIFGAGATIGSDLVNKIF